MELEMKEEVRRFGYPVGRHRSAVSQGVGKKKTRKISKRDDGSAREDRSSTGFHEPLNFIITILLGVLAQHSLGKDKDKGKGISPLVEHDAIMPLFIIAMFIYCTTLLGIKLGPQNADYLPMLKFVCVTFAILACELLASILINPLFLVMINLYGILVELLRRRWYKQVYELLYTHATQSASQAFNRFALFGGTKKQDQDDGSQIADIV